MVLWSLYGLLWSQLPTTVSCRFGQDILSELGFLTICYLLTFILAATKVKAPFNLKPLLISWGNVVSKDTWRVISPDRDPNLSVSALTKKNVFRTCSHLALQV